MDEERRLEEALHAVRVTHFDAGGAVGEVAGLAASAEHGRIAACLAALASFDLKRVFIPAQTAFWLNVFNAAVLRDCPELVLAQSRHDVEAFFERARLAVGGFSYSLDDIEHGLLRGNLPKFGRLRPPMRRDDPRLAHIPLAFDERMHFGMYSMSRSSPPFRVFDGGMLDAQLEEAAEDYLRRHVRVERGGAVVVLPRLLYWYATDFGGEQGALAFALARLDPEMLEPVDRRLGRVKIRYADYDWTLHLA